MKIRHLLPFLIWLKSLFVKKPQPSKRMPGDILHNRRVTYYNDTKGLINHAIESLNEKIDISKADVAQIREELSAAEFSLNEAIAYRDDLQRSLERLA
jgi:hypothetical protein